MLAAGFSLWDVSEQPSHPHKPLVLITMKDIVFSTIERIFYKDLSTVSQVWVEALNGMSGKLIAIWYSVLLIKRTEIRRCIFKCLLQNIEKYLKVMFSVSTTELELCD